MTTLATTTDVTQRDDDDEMIPSTGESGQTGQDECPSIRATLLLSLMTWGMQLVVLALITYFAALLPNGAFPRTVITWRALATRWSQWDSQLFYLPLVVHGYQHQYVWQQIQANFFPLYPGMVHLVWLLTGKRHLVGSALCVSLLGALAAIAGVAMLARNEGWSHRQLRTTLLLFVCASPLAFFLFAPYPMGWLVATVAWSLAVARWRLRDGRGDGRGEGRHNGRRWAGRWYVAPLIAFFAPLLHPTGMALYPALVVEFALQQCLVPPGPARARRFWRSLRHRLTTVPITTVRAESLLQTTLVLLSAPEGLLFYCWYCRVTYHDPLMWLHTQQHWFQHLSARWPWQSIGLVIHNWQTVPTGSYEQARLLVDLLPLLFVTGVLLADLAAVLSGGIGNRLRRRLGERRWWPSQLIRLTQLRESSWRCPASFVCLWLALLYLCIATPVVGTIIPDVILSAGRYLLAVVPLPLVLARWTTHRPTLLTLLLVSGFAVQMVCLALYLNGQWIV